MTVPASDELPLDLLLRLARREVEDDDGEQAMPSLVALQRNPTRAVFDRAAALACDSDPTQRALGVRILRELGDEDPRPFRAETIALLRRRLVDELDPDVLRWVVSALGHHRASEALPQVLALADHPDDRVRFHVAAALPGLVDLDAIEPAAAATLLALCQDSDPDTRYYALYSATREIGSLTLSAVLQVAAALVTDPDDQVSAMAAVYLQRVQELRTLLPAADDRLIVAILATLGWTTDPRDLETELRRHQPTGTPADLAVRLVTWWEASEDRFWSIDANQPRRPAHDGGMRITSEPTGTYPAPRNARRLDALPGAI